MPSFATLTLAALPFLTSALAQVNLEKRWINDWNVTKCNWAPTTICNNQKMLFDPYTNGCYNPARHPDPNNCAYLEQAYDSNSEECYLTEAGYELDCNDQCQIYDYVNGTCYIPQDFPNDFNCALFGQFYNPYKNECCDVNPYPDNNNNPPPSNGCENGQLPVIDDSCEKTGECAYCGWCQPYQGHGEPACTKWGECTLICPSGQSVHKEWGLLYCK